MAGQGGALVCAGAAQAADYKSEAEQKLFLEQLAKDFPIPTPIKTIPLPAGTPAAGIAGGQVADQAWFQPRRLDDMRLAAKPGSGSV
jgi:hypothetical protein